MSGAFAAGAHGPARLPRAAGDRALRQDCLDRHVRALRPGRLPDYFAKLYRLLAPGGLLLNHGITAGGTRNHQLGSGLGDFIERYIFPGG